MKMGKREKKGKKEKVQKDAQNNETEDSKDGILGLAAPKKAKDNLLRTEVNISPKISISAQPLKMALHRNPAMHGSRIVIFLHESKKTGLFARLKALFLHDSKVNSLKPARYHIIHCIVFYFVFLGTAL